MSEDNVLSNNYLPAGRAALYLGVSISSLAKWEEEGTINSVSKDGQRYYKVEDLEVLLNRLVNYTQLESQPSQIKTIFVTSILIAFLAATTVSFLLTLFYTSPGTQNKLAQISQDIEEKTGLKLNLALPQNISEVKEKPSINTTNINLREIDNFSETVSFESLVKFLGGAKFGTSTLTISENGALSTNQAITVAGVKIIESDGKIPSLTGSFFKDLDGSEITNVNAWMVGGLQSGDFLRSDESDTAEGAINFTGTPGGNGVGGGPLYVNPGGSTAGYTLLGVALNGSLRFKIDAEGDATFNGNLSPVGSSQDIGSSSEKWRNLYLSGDFDCSDCIDFTDLENSLEVDEATDINLGTNALTIDLDSTGDFSIRDLTTDIATFADNGKITFAPTSGQDFEVSPDGNGSLYVHNDTYSAAGVGLLQVDSVTSTSLARAASITTTFTGTGASTSYGLEQNWTSSAVVTGVGVSQTAAGILNEVLKTGADTATGTYTVYGIYNNVSNTGSTNAGTKDTIAGRFIATGDSAGTSNAYGLHTRASGADNNIGLHIAASATAASGANYGINIAAESAAATTNYGININSITGAGTDNYALRIQPVSGAGTNNVALCFDCDGTWSLNSVGSGIQFGTDANLVTLYRSASNVLQTDDSLVVSGSITSTFSAAGTFTKALCWDNSGSSEIQDCVGTAEADYMEMYPTEEGMEYGDLVAIGNQYTTTIHGDRLSKLTKATEAYQPNLLGVISNKEAAGDFNSIGYNIRETDNPQPVALVGRIPVKVSEENGSIRRGDYITSSTIPGVGMKATRPGNVVGQALEDLEPGKTKIMVYVKPTFADPTNALAQFTLDEAGNLVIPNIKTANITIDPLASATQTPLTLDSQSVSLFEKIAELESQIAQLSEQIGSSSEQSATGSAELTNTSVTDIIETEIEAGTAVFTESLTVLGSTSLNSLGVTGSLTTGSIVIRGIDGEIENLSTSPFKIQPNAFADVDFMDGKVVIGKDGNITIDGTLTAKEIKANKIIINSSPDVLSETTEASIGSGKINAGETTTTIETSAVTSDSKVFVTARNLIDKPLAITNIVAGSSFEVAISSSAPSDISFDWWIVDSR